MKFRKITNGFSRAALLVGLGLSTLILTSCASLEGALGMRASSLPIRSSDTSDTRLVSVHAYEVGDQLRISGSGRGCKVHTGHIDFELVDARGAVIALRRVNIYPSQRIIGIPDPTYFGTSFPLEDAKKAVAIRVVYHLVHTVSDLQ